MLRSIAMLCVAVLVAISAAEAAHAQPRTQEETEKLLTEKNYARGSYLFGVMGFYAVENSPFLGPDSYIGSGGFYLRVGARHNRWLATDVTGQYVHNFVSNRNIFAANRDAFLAWGVSLNERVYFTKSRIQPYVSVGVGWLQISSRNRRIQVSDNPPLFIEPPSGFSPGFSPRFGAGLELFWTENVAVNLEATYNLTVGKIDGFDFMTFGLGFTFY